MKVGEVLELFSNGQNSKSIAVLLGCSASHVGRTLNRFGYEWDNSAKKWKWLHHEEQPLESDFSAPKTKKVERVPPVSNPEVEVNTPPLNIGWNQKDWNDLHSMIDEWRNGKNVNTPQDIYDRIKRLPQGEKTKKNIVLLDVIGENLDNFCKQERVGKSDVLNLALLEFFERESKS